MSETYQKIKSEIINAMKSKESEKLLALRSLDSTIKNLAINSGHREGPTEEDALSGLAQMVKRGTDSSEQFRMAGRMDLYEVENFQVTLFKTFLPTQLEKSEVKSKILQELGESVSSLSQKDFGRLMKMFGESLKGQTDNKTISESIREILVLGGV